MAVTVDLDLSEVRAAFARGQEALAKATDEALLHLGQDAARAAKADHPYTDRTGDLTGSIQATPGNTHEVVVEAGTDYASYVEQGTSRSKPYPYLQPAVDRVTEDPERHFVGVAKHVADAMNHTLRRVCASVARD